MKFLITILFTLFIVTTATGSDLSLENKSNEKNSSQNKIEFTDEFIRELYEIKAELKALQTSLNHKIDLDLKNNINNDLHDIERTYKPLFQEMQKEAEFLFNFAKYLFWIFFGLVSLITLSGVGLIAYLKKLRSEYKINLKKYEKLNEDVKNSTKKLATNSSKHFNEKALSMFSTWNGTNEEINNQKLIKDIVKIQNEAIIAFVETYGENLKELNEKDQRRLVTYWQNYANYVAHSKDPEYAIKAIEYAREAFKYGTTNERLANNLYWIGTYFFVLRTFDSPNYRKEWIERYEAWSEKLKEHNLDQTANEKYYNRIKNNNSDSR